MKKGGQRGVGGVPQTKGHYECSHPKYNAYIVILEVRLWLLFFFDFHIKYFMFYYVHMIVMIPRCWIILFYLIITNVPTSRISCESTRINIQVDSGAFCSPSPNGRKVGRDSGTFVEGFESFWNVQNQLNILKTTPECDPDKFHSGHIREVLGEDAHNWFR